MKKKMPKLDMGGLYMGTSMSKDVANQPVSGYGMSQGSKCPPNCGPGSGAKHSKQVRSRQQQRTKVAKKNIGKCGRKSC